MAVDIHFFHKIKLDLQSHDARLIAVSKMKPVEVVKVLYDAGQHDFGENYVQELVQKQPALPQDINWHFIGHLQRNKVKYIAPFISMIQSVDNLALLKEINKQAKKQSRIIDCLLQVHVGKEETKFGLDENEFFDLVKEVVDQPENFTNIHLCGLMGMATNTRDEKIIRQEFHRLKTLCEKIKEQYARQLPYFSACSMGMSGDYELALQEGSTMVRIGSLLFGNR